MADELSIDIKNFLERDSTKSFLKAAEQFIELVEMNTLSQQEFYKKIFPSLVDLYSAGQKLDEIELKYSSGNTNFHNSRERFFINNNRALISSLGQDAFYWEVFDPYVNENDNEPTQGWLVDDFEDIYRDLKIELEIMKLGTDEAIEHALWGMKFGFVHHWGQHCISALRALHFLWYGGQFTG